MSYKKKSSIPETVATLLPGAVANANVLELAKVRRWWLSRFNNPLRSAAVPFAVEGSRLIIHVSSSTWLQELHYLKAQVLQEIRGKFPRTCIADVIVRIGPLPQTLNVEPPAAAPVRVDAQPPMTEAFARSLSKIHDDDLRAAISNQKRPEKKDEES